MQTAFSKYLENIGTNVWNRAEKVGKLGLRMKGSFFSIQATLGRGERVGYLARVTALGPASCTWQVSWARASSFLVR